MPNILADHLETKLIWLDQLRPLSIMTPKICYAEPIQFENY